MKQFALLALVVVMSLATGAPAAHALSAQTGDSVAGTLSNLTDPDEQSPFVPGAAQNGQSSPSDNFDAGTGQGFVSKDAVQHSMARGSGSYLPPAPEK